MILGLEIHFESFQVQFVFCIKLINTKMLVRILILLIVWEHLGNAYIPYLDGKMLNWRIEKFKLMVKENFALKDELEAQFIPTDIIVDSQRQLYRWFRDVWTSETPYADIVEARRNIVQKLVSTTTTSTSTTTTTMKTTGLPRLMSPINPDGFPKSLLRSAQKIKRVSEGSSHQMSDSNRQFKAYDCSNPRIVKDVSINTERCESPRVNIPNFRNVTIQLIQRQSIQRTSGWRCQILTSRTAFHCGTKDHT